MKSKKNKMVNDNASTIIEKINKIIGSYVEDEILEFKRLSKYSRIAYNFLTITTVTTTSSIPFITHFDNKLLTAGVSTIAAITASINYLYNFKHEWNSHLYGLTYLQGLKKEWELKINLIMELDIDEREKTNLIVSNTEKFLKKFNLFGQEEIINYFKSLREYNEQAKNNSTDDLKK